MLYNSLVSADLPSSLIEKLQFFKANSYFKEINEAISPKSLNTKTSLMAKELKRRARFLLQSVNFFFYEAISDEWSFLLIGDASVPMIIVNETSINSKFDFYNIRFSSKKVMRLKYEFFALVLVSMRLSILADCFEEPKFKYANQIWEFANKISDALLTDASMCSIFDLYWESADELEMLSLRFGKKYFYSVLLALDDKKITEEKAAYLLDVDVENIKNIFEKYIDSASISLYTNEG